MIYALFRIKEKFLRYIRSQIIMKQATCSAPPRVMGKIYINAKNVKIGRNVTFYPGVYLWGETIEIGDNVDIGIGTIIYAKNKVVIGNDTSIAGQSYIIDSNHSIAAGKLIQKQPMDVASKGISIGDDVWIAAQCMILKGAVIHNHAVIGAQTIINKEIPENAVVFGNPAEIKKYRK